MRAACVLHNFVIMNDGIDSHSFNMEKKLSDRKLLMTKTCNNAFSASAKSIRYKFTEYFNSTEGETSWQNEYALPTNLLEQLV